jgi:hypothetical protein
MIQHVLTCIGSWACICTRHHISRAGYATSCVCVCGKAGSCYVECSVYEALRVGAACICVYQVQSWYLRLLPCIESGACMRVACICMYLLLVCTFMHGGLDIFLHVTYQELGVYLHASSHFKPCARM